jgi:hypothetical protein
MCSFSVWKASPSEMQFWSHGHCGDGMLRSKGYATATSWFDADTVLMSDSEGGMALYMQGFP